MQAAASLAPFAPPPDPLQRDQMLRELRRTLIDARDEQLARIVSLVDAMPVRGSADSLIAPLRPRLQQLRPPRLANFTRLLFTPLDPVILPPARWRRNALGIPRTALVPLSAQVAAGIDDRAQILALLQGHTIDDAALVLRAGSRIWTRAANILADAAMPPDWPAATGLGAADYIAIARSVALLLRQAVTIETQVQVVAGGEPVDPQRTRDCLTQVVESVSGIDKGAGAPVVGMLLAILLARLPASADLIAMAGDLAARHADPHARQAADQAIDFMLDAIEEQSGLATDLAGAAEEQQRVVALLEALETPGPAHRPSRKARADKLRRQADAACRTRFETDLSDRILRPATALGPDTSDQEIIALEATARDLRRFEAAGRKLGGAEHYDKCLRKAADRLLAPPSGPGEDSDGVMDRARLVEILMGPDQALALIGVVPPQIG